MSGQQNIWPSGQMLCKGLYEAKTLIDEEYPRLVFVRETHHQVPSSYSPWTMALFVGMSVSQRQMFLLSDERPAVAKKLDEPKKLKSYTVLLWHCLLWKHKNEMRLVSCEINVMWGSEEIGDAFQWQKSDLKRWQNIFVFEAMFFQFQSHTMYGCEY